MQVELNRVRRPVTAPVILQIDLQRLELLVDAIGEEFLDSRILGERDMWADVEQEPAVARNEVVWPP